MGSVNKAILLGRLGADPELKFADNGTAFASFSIATNSYWKDKATEQPRGKAEWHKIKAFGKTAELVGQYLRKGSEVYVEGRLETSKWVGKDQVTRYTTEIIIDEMQFISSKLKDSPPQAKSIDDKIDFDDDIPF